MTTFTNLLRITKQSDGANNETWGQVTNEQVFELFEDAIHNTATINVTSLGPSFSLSTANGATDQARNAGLLFTGTPPSPLSCVVPSVNHIYVVRNTSTQNVTVTTGGAVNVVVAPDTMDILQIIGTDVHSVLSWLPGVGSSVPISRGGTGQTTAEAALNAFLPSQTSNAGRFLQTNGTTPSWQSVSSPFIVGEIRVFAFTATEPGWLPCGGQAISRATYAALFAKIGTSFGPGDGVSTFNLPDHRGRVIAGLNNLGGSNANRLTTAGSGIDGTILGASGGAETHTLTVPQIPPHTHTLSAEVGVPGGAAVIDYKFEAPNELGATGSTGGGLPHNNTQPTITQNICIYAGV